MATKTFRPAHSCVVSAFWHRSRRYEQRLVNCGKSNCSKCHPPGAIARPTHGPYWYLCARRGHKWRRIYLGKELDTEKYIDNDGNIDWTQIGHRRAKGTPGEGSSTIEPGQLDILDENAIQQPKEGTNS